MKIFNFRSKIRHSFKRKQWLTPTLEPISNSLLTHSTPVSFGLRPAISSSVGSSPPNPFGGGSLFQSHGIPIYEF